jgi:hypothetical protein
VGLLHLGRPFRHHRPHDHTPIAIVRTVTFAKDSTALNGGPADHRGKSPATRAGSGHYETVSAFAAKRRQHMRVLEPSASKVAGERRNRSCLAPKCIQNIRWVTPGSHSHTIICPARKQTAPSARTVNHCLGCERSVDENRSKQTLRTTCQTRNCRPCDQTRPPWHRFRWTGVLRSPCQWFRQGRSLPPSRLNRRVPLKQGKSETNPRTGPSIWQHRGPSPAFNSASPAAYAFPCGKTTLHNPEPVKDSRPSCIQQLTSNPFTNIYIVNKGLTTCGQHVTMNAQTDDRYMPAACASHGRV